MTGAGTTGASGTTGANGAAILAGGGTLSTSSTEFLAAGSFSSNTNELNIRVPVTGGSVNNLFVSLSSAPQTGSTARSYVFTVMRNGATTGDTCTVTGQGSTTCSDAVHSQTFAAGDLISLRGAPNNVQTSGIVATWSVAVGITEGPAGPVGATGATGATGANGATGATGTNGTNGTNGATGATGPGYFATSTTSNSIAMGPATWTTQTGLAYVPGNRVRMISSSANYEDGTVTGYTPNTGALTVNIDSINGSGTGIINWSITLTGSMGATGPTGATGPSGGATGATGSQGAAGPPGTTFCLNASFTGIGGTSSGTLDNTQNTYGSILAKGIPNTTVTNGQATAHCPGTLNLSVSMPTAPGGSLKQWTFTVMGTTSPLFCQISGSGVGIQTCSASAAVNITPGQVLNMQVSPFLLPTASSATWTVTYLYGTPPIS